MKPSYVHSEQVTCVIGVVTYLWIIDFPENAYRSFCFMNKAETELAVSRIQHDRGDVVLEPFSWPVLLRQFLDIKIYGFAASLFLLNMVTTALAYFLPIILQGGMGYSENKSILLAAPPYYYAVIPVVITSIVGDKFRLRGPVIFFNSLCMIIGLVMLGFANQVTVRYIGVYLVTGAYISNWAAMNSYQANNITGQWKRVVAAAVTTACNGLGGVAGSYTVRRQEAPRYFTTIWVNIGGQIITIGIVLIFTVYFFLANRKQRRRGKLIERTVGLTSAMFNHSIPSAD
ncbi:hypothetical protein MMC22_010956, partial [Lobaria immixta]|nr:hypothetical protein [Lobaria immixta]